MSKQWYGSVQNRLAENRQFCETIEVGTGMTEYMYSDRHPYEVIEVIDQKHVVVRELDHKNVGGAYSNEWELISNEANPTYLMTKRGKYWYRTDVFTSEMLDDKSIAMMLYMAHNDVDRDELLRRGKITRYHRMNVSFGVAEYYYDYSF